MIQEIRFYLTIFWRRLPLFLLVFMAIATSSVLLAFTLPAIYQAQMKIVVEGTQIPGALAESTVDIPAQEQLQLFETRLLTRENLLDISGQLRPFANQDQMSPDQIVLAMRASTKVSTSAGRDRATLMTISFESPNPQMTARVLDAYLTFLMNNNAQYRVERAEQTQSFFQQEAERLSGELQKQSALIVEFKTKNSDALPENSDFHRQLIISQQTALAQLTRERLNLQEQKQRFLQVFEMTGASTLANGGGNPQVQYLQSLKNQLAELSSVYAPSSQRVVTLKNRITQLEASMAGAANADDRDPEKAMFDLQIADIDGRIAQLDAEIAKSEQNIDDLQGRIARTPENAITLDALQRDYDNIQLQYNRASDSLARAATGERIETLSRGQRISVAERPAVPTQPIKPARKKMALLGIIGGLAAAAATILSMNMLSGAINRSKDLVNGLGVEPMVTIPITLLPHERKRQIMVRLGLCLIVGIVIPIILLTTHFYVMPFDQIIQKITMRMGVNA